MTRDLLLSAGTPVRGRVVDAKGEPVSGADILAGGIELGQSSWSWGVQLPGPRVLAVSGEQRAYTIAVVTDLATVNKTAPDGEMLVYAVDRRSGEPRPEVLAALRRLLASTLPALNDALERGR